MSSSSADSFFLLGEEDRRQFLRIAGRLLGCAYICSWCPLYHPTVPASHLVSADGWHHLEEDPTSSSPSGIISLRLFDAYRRSPCRIQNGCVPGLACVGGIPYVEIRDADLFNLASADVQRQFYREAGIKAAVFVGCTGGEIELGMMMPPNMNMEVNLQQVFAQDFIQSQLRESFIEYNPQFGGGGGELSFPQQHDRSRLSSSSSSLRSLSVGSPDTSSRLLPATTSPLAPEAPFSQLYPFPIPMGQDDEAMARALMLAVISSTSTTTSSPPPLSPPLAYQVLQQQQAYLGGRRRRRVGDHGGAFRVYNPLIVPPKLEAELKYMPGQRVIKKGIDILRRVSTMRMEAQMQEHHRPANSTQLHHMISERRRREKLNENFHALRLLLPPGSKKDKASVLANTRNYLNSLKAQIKDLEERNQTLETQLEEDAVVVADDDEPEERVQVRIISRGAADAPTTSEAAQRTISLRLTVREEEKVEMIDLVLHVLRCLQQMRDDHQRAFTLLSMDAAVAAAAAGSPPNNSPFGRANLRFEIKEGAGDWDEETFKEGVKKAVNDVLDGRRRAATAGPSIR